MQLHYGVGRICAHATYTSGVAFQSSFSIVKLAISETRMKAETLSWSMWLATAQTRFGPQDMAKIGIIIGLPKKTEKKCRREVGNDFSLAYHKVQKFKSASGVQKDQEFKRFNFWSSESRMKFPSILPDFRRLCAQKALFQREYPETPSAPTRVEQVLPARPTNGTDPGRRAVRRRGNGCATSGRPPYNQ